MTRTRQGLAPSGKLSATAVLFFYEISLDRKGGKTSFSFEIPLLHYSIKNINQNVARQKPGIQ